MLIRSQDGNTLVSLDKINWTSASDRGVLASIVGFEKPVYIGKYGTKEKATEVLDMIQRACEGSCHTEYIGITPVLFMNKTVYKMPLDWEK